MKHNDILKKAKTLSLSTALLLSGGMLTGCSDFLEIKPQNEIILEQFWNEQKDVENIITGCYSEMESYGMISRMMIWGEFRSENITYNGTIDKDVDLERLLKENITASNVYTIWDDFYRVINRCNTVIKYAPEVAAKDPSYTDSKLKAHIAEVTALRSLCYFYLIRTFRDVPYSEEAFLDDNQKLDLPATPFNEVLSKLIASLESVVNNSLTKYPENNTQTYWDYNCNRVTKSFIQALLCEMYLWQKDYDNCIKYANSILEQKKLDAKEKGYTEGDFENFGGFPLIASRSRGANAYGNAFNEIFVKNNSMESIFELNFRKDDTNGNQLCNGPVCFFYGADGQTAYTKPTTYVVNDERDALYNVFAKDNGGFDGRAYENIQYGTDGSAVGYYKYAAKGNLVLKSSNTPYKDATYSNLWNVYRKDNNVFSRNKSNYILYRLTDILLLKAEALALKITSQQTITESTPDYATWKEAFDIVDAINKRSLIETTPYKHVLDASNYNTQELLLDLVYAERNRELMFEGKHYFDLVRRSLREENTKYLASKVVNKDPLTAAIIGQRMTKMDAIFWPIYIDELKVNKNLHQNSAFGSGDDSSYEKS